MKPVLLRVQEAAELLKVSKWTIYRWIEEGRLRATKIGQGSLRVFRTSVHGLIGDADTLEARERDHLRTNAKQPRGARRKRDKKKK